jgi:hypothetical protein
MRFLGGPPPPVPPPEPFSGRPQIAVSRYAGGSSCQMVSLPPIDGSGQAVYFTPQCKACSDNPLCATWKVFSTMSPLRVRMSVVTPDGGILEGSSLRVAIRDPRRGNYLRPVPNFPNTFDVLGDVIGVVVRNYDEGFVFDIRPVQTPLLHRLPRVGINLWRTTMLVAVMCFAMGMFLVRQPTSRLWRYSGCLAIATSPLLIHLDTPASR